MMHIDGKTKLFAIIGNPVSHSFSPAMHNAVFRAAGVNGVYVPILSKNIGETMRGLRALGFQGASVTVPHKEAVMEWVDVLDPVARRIGAVNTLVFEQAPGDDKSICIGLNTDCAGSNKALAEQIELSGIRALVLGAGGAAKAVAFGLAAAGAGEITIANRTLEKAEALAQVLDCRALSLAEAGAVQADILINTTSIGMAPRHDLSPVDASLLPRFQVVMDIVYAPLETRLLKEAKAGGCITIDGLTMLQYQGAEQLKLWTGIEPPASIMRNALLQALERL
ncbi:MAG: shikimate dehydrogenase [Desulfobulbus propionicus]|nr:MAG: shikimate dehydrogenase [Desulfobulbus propionicus]